MQTRNTTGTGFQAVGGRSCVQHRADGAGCHVSGGRDDELQNS